MMVFDNNHEECYLSLFPADAWTVGEIQ